MERWLQAIRALDIRVYQYNEVNPDTGGYELIQLEPFQPRTLC